MRRRITQFACESVGLCPFRGSYVRKFELSHSNRVNRIMKITHAHNLHLKMLDFGPFTIRALKKRKLFTRKFFQTIFRNHLGFITTSAIVLCFMQRHDSLTFIKKLSNCRNIFLLISCYSTQ